MAYPHAVALGNDVILAARALVKSRIPATSTFGYAEAIGLIAAVEIYETEVARPQPPTPRNPCEHPRAAWVFLPDKSIQCCDCGFLVPVRDEAAL